jgi:hypothetical protein
VEDTGHSQDFQPAKQVKEKLEAALLRGAYSKTIAPVDFVVALRLTAHRSLAVVVGKYQMLRT